MQNFYYSYKTTRRFHKVRFALANIEFFIKDRRARLAGHCRRAKNEIVSEVLLSETTQGSVNR